VRALLALLCALGLIGAAPPCSAARQVHVYEVDVEGQTSPALQEAMRQVLVRATGRRESADDPALAGVIADAPRYVQGYVTGPRGESQVVFEAATLEQAIGAAGRSVWPRARPFTLVVLDPPRARAALEAARAELERVAAERGLPISLVPLNLLDAAGHPLTGEALLESARRLGGDQVLIGQGAESAPDGMLQWSLYTRTQSATWSGPLAAGIDHTVDLLVPQAQAAVAQADGDVRVRIDGVDTLAAYASVEQLLQSVPGVRRANIAAAEAGSVTFIVTARGGAAGLEQELSATLRLVRVGGGVAPGAQLEYRYQPQG
jgi:Uncharacterized protein conserved in bacteria (DUF2066)